MYKESRLFFNNNFINPLEFTVSTLIFQRAKANKLNMRFPTIETIETTRPLRCNKRTVAYVCISRSRKSGTFGGAARIRLIGADRKRIIYTVSRSKGDWIVSFRF